MPGSNPYDFAGTFSQGALGGGSNPYGGFLSAVLQRRQKDDQARYADVLAKLRAAIASGQGALALPPRGETPPGIPSAPPAAAPSIDASELHTPDDYFARLGGVESSDSYTAVNKASGAGGKYQFIVPTWNSLMKDPSLQLTEEGRTGDSPEARAQQERAVRALTKQNVGILRETLGRAPTHTEAYIAHLLGPGYGSAVLRAPDTPVEALVPSSFVAANPFLKGISGQQLLKLFAKKFAS